MNKKMDIETRADVVLLVDTFYKKVNEDETLGFIFNDIAKVDWPNHLPKMYFFWASMLLGERSYTGAPMTVHIDLSKQTPMDQHQFTTWTNLFTTTVDELFDGEKAREAKLRATNVAGLMLHKVRVAGEGPMGF